MTHDDIAPFLNALPIDIAAKFAECYEKITYKDLYPSLQALPPNVVIALTKTYAENNIQFYLTEEFKQFSNDYIRYTFTSGV